MAKAKELDVSVSFTKNLGNYQSLRLDAGLTVLLEDGEDVEQVYTDTWDRVGDQIQSQLSLFEDEKKSGVKKGFK